MYLQRICYVIVIQYVLIHGQPLDVKKNSFDPIFKDNRFGSISTPENDYMHDLVSYFG